jgi:enamine deaminase RidA (YjgF/YER057c/UK114 family)
VSGTQSHKTSFVKPREAAMSNIDRRLTELGITLPRPWGSAPGKAEPRVSTPGEAVAQLALGPDVKVYAEFVRVSGRRVLVSGHLPINADGEVAGPFGRVGGAVSAEQAEACARRVILGIFASLVREIGSLDRISNWLRLYGMVNAAPDFHDFPRVINAASRLVYEVFGQEIGKHARVAIGVGGLPFNAPVEIEAELELDQS